MGVGWRGCTVKGNYYLFLWFPPNPQPSLMVSFWRAADPRCHPLLYPHRTWCSVIFLMSSCFHSDTPLHHRLCLGWHFLAGNALPTLLPISVCTCPIQSFPGCTLLLASGLTVMLKFTVVCMRTLPLPHFHSEFQGLLLVFCVFFFFSDSSEFPCSLAQSTCRKMVKNSDAQTKPY